MGQTLRPYQTDAVNAVFDAIDMGHNRILYTQATGCGKTTTFAELIRLFLEYHNYKVLVLAHRRELITQAYERIFEHCGLDEYQIGIELAETRAPSSAKVVVGSIQTVKGAHRLPNFIPDVIITDEAHRCGAASYHNTLKRFKTINPDVLYIGCTATAKRTDRKSLYAIKPDGSFVQLVNKKTKAVYDADPSETVFQTHCYEFSILDAIEGGWLVPIVGHTVQTATDLNDVETDTDGDFKDGQLQKSVDNAERTNLAISAWKEIAADRPTIVFCAGVEHAHHAADLWRQAGYTAVALDGETDSYDRAIALKDFRNGKIQVLCNMGLFTEGTDLPTCACVIHLRPTKSWNLFVQMSGRGSRVLPGVLEGIDDAEERKAAIAASNKKDCLIIDLVDICENNDLCTVPSILDLPANLDLEGQSVTAAKKLLDEFEEVKEQVIGECPTTYRQLQVRLEQVQLIRNSGAKSSADWKASEHGFRFGRTPVGYQTELERIGPNQFELIVRHGGKELLRKTGKPTEDFRAYLDNARVRAMRAIEEHKETTVKGTLARLTSKQVGCLRANGHTRDEIDRMTAGYAKVLVSRYMEAWKSRQEQQEAYEDRGIGVID